MVAFVTNVAVVFPFSFVVLAVANVVFGVAWVIFPFANVVITVVFVVATGVVAFIVVVFDDSSFLAVKRQQKYKQ